jgi:hypothetical protein
LSHRYCFLPLSWKSWNTFECAVVGVAYATVYYLTAKFPPANNSSNQIQS